MTRRRGVCAFIIFICQGIGSLGCLEPRTFAFVELRDPSNLTATATRITIGETLDLMTEHLLPVNSALPLEFTLRGKKPGEIARWFEARDKDNRVLARGYSTKIVLGHQTRERGAAKHIVLLRKPCDLVDANTVLNAAPSCTLDNDPDARAVCNGEGGCVLSVCGDTLVDISLGENCDDGNDNENDACLNDCTWNVCGDGKICSDASCSDVP